jgi:hypothetical protein
MQPPATIFAVVKKMNGDAVYDVYSKVIDGSLSVYRPTSWSVLYLRVYPAVWIGHSLWNRPMPTIVSFPKRLGFLNAGGP